MYERQTDRQRKLQRHRDTNRDTETDGQTLEGQRDADRQTLDRQR